MCFAVFDVIGQNFGLCEILFFFFQNLFCITYFWGLKGKSPKQVASFCILIQFSFFIKKYSLSSFFFFSFFLYSIYSSKSLSHISDDVGSHVHSFNQQACPSFSNFPPMPSSIFPPLKPYNSSHEDDQVVVQCC